MFYIKNLKFKSILDIEEMNIEEHKITSIVGKSGSGKTTLLKMLNKMFTPDSGQILYKGKNILEINAIELRRGESLQIRSLYQKMIYFEL